MTAWCAIVVPLFIIAKCSINFLVLEYGSKFQVMTDDHFTYCFALLIVIAVIIDALNCIRVLARGGRDETRGQSICRV